jgi:hypothetical protein
LSSIGVKSRDCSLSVALCSLRTSVSMKMEFAVTSAKRKIGPTQEKEEKLSPLS